jgi:hypothetical protein
MITVLPLTNSPAGPRHFFAIHTLVWTSNAASTSSKIKICAFEYTALASVIRAFCPPLSVKPLSPTSVSSPAEKSTRSGRRLHS